ncbi:TolC family protein [Helicobacter burdigaliensis]|uniref:TolC family protein n=1 Tax=Helicobacter burdigaliensis TaxID=2315334 RepID=UPI001E60DE23|nr:TolC family protein [Helicobacter burdigaliensis]
MIARGIVFVLLFFMGCAKIPQNEELVQNLPLDFNNQKLIPIADFGGIATPQEQLEIILKDENLNHLYKIGIANNLDLAIMQSRILQAKSSLKIAFSELFPKVDGSFSGSKNNTTYNFTSQVGANLSWELDIFGKNKATSNSKESLYQKSIEDFKATQITLLADITSMYYNLQEYALNIKLTQKNIMHYKQVLELTRLKVENGLLDSTELFTKQDLLTNEQNTLETLKMQFEETKNALLVLLNLKTLPLVFEDSFVFKESFEFSYEKLPSNAILSRPDIRANIFLLHSQIYTKQSAFSSLFPILSLSGNVSEILQGNQNVAWSLASSLSAPLLNRTQLTQNYFLQDAILKETYLNLQKTLDTAFFEIENALFNLKNMQLQMQNNKMRFNNAQEYFTFSLNRRSIGLIDELEFQENYASYNNSKKTLNTSKNSQIQALVGLFKAMGGNLYVAKEKK